MTAIMFLLGIVIIGNIQKHSDKTWFAIFKVFSESILLNATLLLLLNISAYKNKQTNQQRCFYSNM